MAMQNKTNFHMLVEHIYYSSAIVSILLNSLSVFLIATRSPKQLGDYKHLMIIIAVYEILYSLLDSYLVPIHYSHGPAIVELVSVSDKRVCRSALIILNLVYWIFFGASLTILSLHFIYRWLVVSESLLLSTFQSWKLGFWLMIPILMGVIWMANGYYLCSPDKRTSDYVRDGVLQTFGKSIDDFEYFGVHVYHKTADGQVNFNFRSIISLAIMLLTIACTFLIIVYYGVKCYRKITDVMQISSSSQMQSLQKQLFYALVTQTLVPILLVHIPTAVLLLFAFLNIELGSKSVFVSIMVALYPSLEPLPNLLIVKSYREPIIDCFKCKRRSAEQSYEATASANLFQTSTHNVPVTH